MCILKGDLFAKFQLLLLSPPELREGGELRVSRLDGVLVLRLSLTDMRD